MLIKKSPDLRAVFLSIYIAFFAAYLFVGLQPAGAESYEISALLEIPTINLTSDVTTLHQDGRNLTTPDQIVGSFTRSKHRTLLIGHSTTVFQNLWQLQNGDKIIYDDTLYVIENIETIEKSSVDMEELLRSSSSNDSLVLMTCAGDLLGNGDATHRLIITASSM